MSEPLDSASVEMWVVATGWADLREWHWVVATGWADLREWHWVVATGWVDLTEMLWAWRKGQRRVRH